MVSAAVLVSGDGTNLQALLDAQNTGEFSHVRISLVVSSNPKAYALERAREAGIPSAVADTDAAILALLRAYGIQAVVLAGFLKILGPELLEAYRDRILNVHPSLLPAFGGKGMYGLRVHRAALDAGVKVTGATVHLVSDVVDGGRILLQKAVEVRSGDTPETLQRRVMEQAEWVLLPEALELCGKQWEEEKTWN